MKCFGMVVAMLLSSSVNAQPARPAIEALLPTSRQNVVQRQHLSFLSKRARHAYLSTHDSTYRSALSWRAAATTVAIAGGCGGVVLAVVGIVTSFKGIHISQDVDATDSTTSGGAGTALLLGGLATAVFSVAVGVPIALSAHRRIAAIRSRYPIAGVAVTHDTGAVQLAWRF